MINLVKDIKNIASGFLGTTRTIQTFFKILSLSEIGRDDCYRENFWKQYLDAGYIKQSWFILAPRMEAIACKELNIKPYQFGSLIPDQQPDIEHGVLLMRLDHLIVAEWSHANSSRFWYQHSVHSPRLFKANYRKDELIDNPDYLQQHYFAAKGLWQKEAAAWMSAKVHVPTLR